MKKLFLLAATVVAMASLSSCSKDDAQEIYVKQDGSSIVEESNVKGTWTSVSCDEDSTDRTYTLSLSLNGNGNASYTMTCVDTDGGETNSGYTLTGSSTNYSFSYDYQAVYMFVDNQTTTYKDGVTSNYYSDDFVRYIYFCKVDSVMKIKFAGYVFYCTK